MLLFLKPYFEKKPWAGDTLCDIYDCAQGTGEAWIVSGYKGKSSTVIGGKYDGCDLFDLWNNHRELFSNFKGKEFPVLIKLIDSKEDLSVQVHPNDNYALKTKNSLGKYECWYILDGTTAKNIVVGVNARNSKELKDIIDEGKIEDYLNLLPIKKHDLIVIEPGTVHAIKGGTFLLETQESSDITYRLYDYNREPKRELHIEDSLNVIDYNNRKYPIFSFDKEDSLKADFFNIHKLLVDGPVIYQNKGFEIFYVESGNGYIEDKPVKKGDTFILSNEDNKFVAKGNMVLIAIVPKERNHKKNVRKVALVTGITGQDGTYLTELLLSKGYEVHGLVRRLNIQSDNVISQLMNNPEIGNKNLFLHYGDMTDSSSVNKVIEDTKPDEIYNLAAQSHVDLSFDMPEYTGNVNGLGTIRLLEAIRQSGIHTKFFQASSCKMYSGYIDNRIIDENTPTNPVDPYGLSKAYAHQACKFYRNTYHMFVSCGIMFAHDSPRREETYVYKKITEAVNRISKGSNEVLCLGNLDAVREWGKSKDYAKAMYELLQEDKPCDKIISLGKLKSVREFTKDSFAQKGIHLEWFGEGFNETGKDDTNNTRVVVSKQNYRK